MLGDGCDHFFQGHAADTAAEVKDGQPIGLLTFLQEKLLKRLAQALDFQLSFNSESDPLVSVNAIRQSIDLVARLAPLENVSMTQARNPRCPQRERIVKVWVLPKGQGGPMRAAMTPTNARQARETDEQAQAGIDMILNGHGMVLQGNERVERAQGCNPPGRLRQPV